jgi:dTDP-4-amino-4,6-dideoxygalactose transaminase
MNLISKLIELVNILFKKRYYGFIKGHQYLTKKRITTLQSIIYSSSFNESIRSNYETSFAKLIGEGKAVSFASGRMAFYAYMKSINISEGDEVILTGFTCSVMANSVLRLKAIPVYCDIDPKTFGMSPIELPKLINSKTKLIVAQHSFGIPCKIDEIVAIAKSHGIPVLEDCAISLDSKINGKLVGTFGDAAIFSTDHSKPLNTLIGGILYTSSLSVYKAVELINKSSNELSLKHQKLILGRIKFEKIFCNPRKYKYYIFLNMLTALKNKFFKANEAFLINEFCPPEFENRKTYDYPSKLPVFLAQLGLWELENWPQEKERRKRNLSSFVDILQNKIDLPPVYKNSSYDIVPLRFVFNLSNPQLLNRINNYFDTSWFWFRKPIIATTYNIMDFGYNIGNCKIAEKIGENIVNLPCHLEESEMIFLREILS